MATTDGRSLTRPDSPDQDNRTLPAVGLRSRTAVPASWTTSRCDPRAERFEAWRETVADDVGGEWRGRVSDPEHRRHPAVNGRVNALASSRVVAVTGIPVRPPADAPVPTYREVDSHEALIEWSRAYGRRVAGTTDVAVTLDRVDWEVSTRAKRRAAAVVHPRIADAAVGEPIDWTTREEGAVAEPPHCTMRLTWGAAEGFDREAWARTMRHELVHVEQFQRFGTTGHGPWFRDRAEALETTVRCERFAEPKYVLTCPDCGEVVARRYRDCKLVRRHESYRSSCCDAPLSLRRTGARSR